MKFSCAMTTVVVISLQCADAQAATNVERPFRSIKLGMSSTQVSHLIKRPVQNFCNQSNDLVQVKNKNGKFEFRMNPTGHITHKSLLYNTNVDVKYDELFKELSLKYNCNINKIMKVEYTGYVAGFVPLSSIRQHNSNLEETQNEEGLKLYLIPRDKKGFRYFSFCKMQSKVLAIGGWSLCQRSKLFCPVYHPGWSGARF